LTEAIPISRTELTQEDIKRLFDYQTHLNEEKIKYKQVIGDILSAFDTREVLGWKKAKKIAKLELPNRYILQYNQVRKQLVAVNKKLRALEKSE